MAETEKVAISLTKSLRRQIEELRRETGESRSGFIRRAVQRLLDDRARAERISQYIEGYRSQPETDEEVEAAQLAATELLAGEPWL